MDQREGAPAELESGKWSGEYIDASGVTGELTMNLEVSADGLAGSYELVLRTEDAPQMIRGELRGLVEHDRIELRPSVGDSKEGLAYSAQLASARTYARQALFGLATAAPGSDLVGGVWIAWRFARPER